MLLRKIVSVFLLFISLLFVLLGIILLATSTFINNIGLKIEKFADLIALPKKVINNSFRFSPPYHINCRSHITPLAEENYVGNNLSN